LGYIQSRKLKSGELSWRFIYYYFGRRKAVKIGKTNKRTATIRAGQFEEMLALGKDPAVEIVGAYSPGITLEKLKSVDVKWCKNRFQPRTIRMTEYAFEVLIDWAGNKPLSSINKRLGESYLEYLKNEKKWASTTINMALRTLRASFQRAVTEHRLLRENPWIGIKPYRVIKSSDHVEFLSVGQVETLLNEVKKGRDVEFYRLIRFYLLTGCRRNEALDVNPLVDIKMDEGVIYLGQPESRTKLRRDFPLSDSLRDLLKECNLSKRRLFNFNTRQVNSRLSRLGKKVDNLPDRLYPHLLRHTFASYLVMDGADMRTVADLLGHTTTKVTELYSHLLEGHKLKTLSKLPW